MLPDRQQGRRMMAKRYLVTGAAGHLGSTILRMLSETDAEVYGLLLPGEQPVVISPHSLL